MSRIRPVDAARIALGGVLVAAPGVPIRVTGSAGGPVVTGVVRVLGVRYVVQGVGVSWSHEQWAPALGTAVELLHAASMVGLAALSRSHRRLAVASAVVASTLGVVDLVAETGS